MAFDFENNTKLTGPFDSVFEQINEAIADEFLKITDIPELFDKVSPTTVSENGYWEADRYFTLENNLREVLKNLGYEPFYAKTSDDVNGFMGLLNGAFVFCLDLNTKLDEPVKLINVIKSVEKAYTEILEDAPIIVFQHTDEPITINLGKGELILDQSAYDCIRDAIVFKGVFRAHGAGKRKYRLERIFSKYIFDIDKMVGNSALPHKSKLREVKYLPQQQ